MKFYKRFYEQYQAQQEICENGERLDIGFLHASPLTFEHKKANYYSA